LSIEAVKETNKKENLQKRKSEPSISEGGEALAEDMSTDGRAGEKKEGGAISR